MMRAFPHSNISWRGLGAQALLSAAVLCGGAYGTNAMAAAKTHTIVIDAMQFSPATLQVRPGDTIVWVNKDPFPHNATANDHNFRSKDIATNGSWKFKARKKGTFPYICTLHPTMKATLIVK